MKKLSFLVPAALWLAAAPLAAEVRVIANVGLQGSEAARMDAQADIILVSNLGQRGPGNDGFISRFSPEGAVETLKWIEGGKGGVTLIDPLGMFVRGDTLYVADTDTVRRFDRVSGAPKGDTKVPGAVRLNDLSVDARGDILISDSGNDDTPGALWKISAAGVVTAFVARDEALERPNGVAWLADGSMVHGGRGVNLVFRSPDGRILREQTLPTGRFDGIVPLANGSMLVSSQAGNGVYLLPPTGKPVMVATDIAVPAAIGYDAKRNRLLIPQIVASSLTLVDLP